MEHGPRVDACKYAWVLQHLVLDEGKHVDGQDETSINYVCTN